MRQVAPSHSFAGIHAQRQRQSAKLKWDTTAYDAARLDRNFDGDKRAQGDYWEWLTVEGAERLASEDER